MVKLYYSDTNQKQKSSKLYPSQYSKYYLKSNHTGRKQNPKKELNQYGIVRYTLLVIIVFVLIIVGFEFVSSHQSSTVLELKSNASNLCLDVHHSKFEEASEVDSWGCNGTDAQNWQVKYSSIQISDNYCLSVANNNKAAGSGVVLDKCNSDPGQVWLRSNYKFENPNSDTCLNIPDDKGGVQLNIEKCNDVSTLSNWTPLMSNTGKTVSLSCSGVEGEGAKIACVAAQQWDTWQTGSVNHNNLLNTYSDGNSYEEWCADFVSYVYMTAGYPFSQGERNGWDEYNANNIQYMGFTMHMASSNYVPQTGDVAFFDYNGGHVEIVESGGKTPSFIYGDSGTTDPTTGNGDMASNTIVNDGSEGQLIYYLSPDN